MLINHNKEHGFTLIELMIVVAIIAILAAVAFASYSAYVRQSHNSEATSMLADIRMKQESYRATFHQYADLSDDGWQPDRDSLISQAVAWPDPSPASWRQLGVRTVGSVYFIYAGSCGTPGDEPDSEYTDAFSGTSWYTNDFWYGAKALQNFNGGDTCEGFIASSGESRISEYSESCP